MSERRQPSSAAQSYRKPPLRRRSWVRQGSPLWALMGLLDFVGWVCNQMVEAVKWIDSKVPDVPS